MVKDDVKAVIEGLSQLPGLITVDLDKLQLENEADEDPINLPAVYMSWSTEWGASMGTSQNGTTSVTLRVASEHYRDSKAGAANFSQAMDDLFDLPEAIIMKMESCGFTLRSDTVDPLFTNVKVHRYTFEAPVIRSKTSQSVKKAAALETSGNILPD